MFKIFNKKYRFFKEKVEAVTKQIWELEFKVLKSRQIREGVRQDRDRYKEAIIAISDMIKKETDKDKLEKLQEELKNMEESVVRYERQMQLIDGEINGIIAEGENPGQEGIIDRIKGYVELKEMYKEYLNTL